MRINLVRISIHWSILTYPEKVCQEKNWGQGRKKVGIRNNE
jgi:hypothetical protein